MDAHIVDADQDRLLGSAGHSADVVAYHEGDVGIHRLQGKQALAIDATDLA